MKVFAIKGIEEMGNLWGVRYTRQHGKNVQDAYLLCDTLDKAKEKFRELMDVLEHHNGVYVSKKAQRQAKARAKKPLQREVLNPSYERISGSIAALRAWDILSQEQRKLLVQGLQW